MKYDPFVHDRKTVFMQRLADYVRMGYRHYAYGEVPVERAAPLAVKFSRLYAVHLSRNQNARLRRDGQAAARMLLWQGQENWVVFFLLLTPGQHAAYQLEEMRQVRDRSTRLTLGDYELVQRQRSGTKVPSWTWRLTPDAYEGWRCRILEVCRGGNDYVVQQCIDGMLCMPGFSGIREQVKKLKWLFVAEWKRRRPDAAKNPMTGARQRYVQRLANSGHRLSQLVKISADIKADSRG